MRISGRSKSVGGASPLTGAARSSSQDKVDSLAASVLPRNDDVELSDSSREVDKAKSLLSAMPDTRMEKVQEIKPLVENGSYQIASGRVAKKMVDSALRESVNVRKQKR
ncbi:TPA: flagellar biosynthesis anti-sigma factor FlgM [Candidatus Sumerlaeota bacterium]|nr:flagellar biosynthesis anti-sigma factor FlgM [Candidatus Sumerlaeota bacterium]